MKQISLQKLNKLAKTLEKEKCAQHTVQEIAFLAFDPACASINWNG